MSYTLHHGDCIEVMRTLPAESVDAIVTSPPYAEQRKSTYGGVPERDYPAWTVAWMLEARRLLKPDGSVIINIRPHVRGGQISDYVLRTRLALRDEGWHEPDELVWHKPNARPTAPANRPRRSWEQLLWYAKTARPYCDPFAAGTPNKRAYGRESHETSDAARRNGWGHDRPPGKAPVKDKARVTTLAAFSNTTRSGYDHPAPFPWQLAEWCGKLICPPGGTILDPFNGSASTGVAAIRNGWDYIGIDAVQEYIDMSHVRLAQQLGEAT